MPNKKILKKTAHAKGDLDRVKHDKKTISASFVQKGLKSFGEGEWPEEYSKLENAKVVLIPVPFDVTSSWIKGANKGPKAIIEASVNLENYDIELDEEIFLHGIHTAEEVKAPSDPKAMTEKVYSNVKKYLGMNKMPVVIGGEHSVSFGAVQAYKEKFKDLSVLQLDAHTDLRQEYHGSKYNHACVMARIQEICPIVQVGIRSLDKDELKFAHKDRIFFAHEICSGLDTIGTLVANEKNGMSAKSVIRDNREVYTQDDTRNHKNWQDKAIEKLSDKVYITIDLDAFDPGIFPATGTPEPGGLQWYQTLHFLRKVCRKREVVGFDVVELCPQKYDKTSDYLAAKLIYKLIGYIFEGNRSTRILKKHEV